MYLQQVLSVRWSRETPDNSRATSGSVRGYTYTYIYMCRNARSCSVRAQDRRHELGHLYPPLVLRRPKRDVSRDDSCLRCVRDALNYFCESKLVAGGEKNFSSISEVRRSTIFFVRFAGSNILTCFLFLSFSSCEKEREKFFFFRNRRYF